MFHHVVLMKFTRDAGSAFRDEVETYCRRIREEIPAVQGYVFKPNLASRCDGLDWAIVSAFEDSRAHDRYQVSPLHQRMKAFMTPFIERIVVCDVDEAAA